MQRFIFLWCAVPLTFLLAGFAAGQTPEPQPNGPALDEGKLPVKFERYKPDPKDDELKKLLKERFNAALDEVEARYRMLVSGMVITLDVLPDAQRRLVIAGLELREEPADKIELLKNNVEVARAIEKLIQGRAELRRARTTELYRATHFRLDAEIELLRAKQATEKAKGKK